MPATGDIHPGQWDAGFCTADKSLHPGKLDAGCGNVDQRLLYIFGGDEGDWQLHNCVSTLSVDGKFTRLQLTGDDIPSPRRGHQCWFYDDMIYSFGGFVKEIDETKKEEYVERKSAPGTFYTNQVLQFDIQTNSQCKKRSLHCYLLQRWQ